MINAILSDVRVVELAESHAAAVAGLLLAEAGADVAKVESDAGSENRSAASFAVWNRSKQSVRLSLETEEGRANLHRLLSAADILLTDWTPARRSQAGLDDAALAGRYPSLIQTSIGGWPAGHSLAERPVDDTLVLAESGLMDEQRGVREGPIYLRFPLGSWGAAYLAAIGTVARLIQRGRKRGTGPVKTSLLQGALVPTAMLWRRAEHALPALMTSMGKDIATPQFICADGVWLHLKAPPDNAPKMRAALDDLGPERVTELNKGWPSNHNCPNWGACAHVFKTRPSAEWLDDLWAADVPVQADVALGAIYADEQAAANDYVVEVDDPVFGRTRQPGPPVATVPPMAVSGPAPRLGASPPSLWDGLAPGDAGGTDDGGLPLAGVRAVDFGAYLAGPLAMMLLADLGADVVKVEGVSGDIMRRVEGAFIGSQRGKRSLALDLKHAAAGGVVQKLAGWADIVHHNIRLPAARRLGLDYPALAAANPELVFCHVSSYGPRGPRRDWPGYDQLFQAQTGWEYEGAGEGNQPMWHRFGMMDHQAAMASLLGSLLALYHRDRTGDGQAVAASLLGASLLTVSEAIVLPDGALSKFARLDALQMGIAPGRRLYQAHDGWVALVADEPEALQRFLKAVGARDAQELAPVLSGMAVSQIVAAAQGTGATAVEAKCDQRDAFFDSAENRALHLVHTYDHARLGRLEMVGAFTFFGDKPAVAPLPPPEIGEHSQTVLHEIGLAASDIEWLVNAGAVRDGARIPATESPDAKRVAA